MTTLGEWLAHAPFGLAMSSGFFSFYAHTGMLSALTARGLRPAHLAGSSAGAMVAGAWAAGLEADDLGEVLTRLTRKDFWDPALGPGLLAGKKFDALLRSILPVHAFDACRVPVRISAFEILGRRTRVIDTGDLPTAIRASCAVPGMFRPVWIDRRPHWDGGVLDRPGLAGAPAGRLLFHHISAPAPWSREDASALIVPVRDAMRSLVIEGLPRSNPFQLDAGRRALIAAREATARALDRTLDGDVVRVVA